MFLSSLDCMRCLNLKPGEQREDMAFWKWFSHPPHAWMTERRKPGGFQTSQLQTSEELAASDEPLSAPCLANKLFLQQQCRVVCLLQIISRDSISLGMGLEQPGLVMASDSGRGICTSALKLWCVSSSTCRPSSDR